MHVAAQEAFGVTALGQGFEVIHQGAVEWPPGHRVVDRLAVRLHGAGAVEVRLGAAFDFQRVHAYGGQAPDMLDGAQVLGIHDVGAVFVFERRHFGAGAVAFLQQEYLLGRCTQAQGRLHFAHDVASGVFGGRGGVILPAASVGAAALVGIALVEVARQQATAGVGHAQGTFSRHGRKVVKIACIADCVSGYRLLTNYPLAVDFTVVSVGWCG
ncbi:hypothetical protein D3C80_143770 [compost metagenome]